MNIDSTITNFSDGGSAPLADHEFISEALRNKAHAVLKEAPNTATLATSTDTTKDDEKKVQFRLNATGNIYYATTSNTVSKSTERLFKSVTVLFAAMTKAMNDENKTLFDYDAWGKIIRGSGFFLELGRYEQTLQIRSASAEVNTQIVQQLLPGLSGSSLMIAKSVLNAINGEFSAGSTNESTKIAHLLFICEELMGAPSVSVRLFYSTKKSHETITKSPCHKTVSQSFEQTQQADTFMFVSPEDIAEFAEKLAQDNEAYQSLIDKLRKNIKPTS